MRSAAFVGLALALAACGVEVVGKSTGAPPPPDAGRAPPPPGAALPPDVPLPPPNPQNLFCDPTNPDLVLCLPFEDDTANRAGNGIGTTVSGNFTFVQPGHEGKSLLPELDFVLSVPNNAATTPSPRSVEAWVMWNGADPNPESCIVVKGTALKLCLAGGGKLRCSTGNSSELLPVDVWTHIACVRSGETLTAFVNGVLTDTRTEDVPADGTEALRVATAPNGNTFPGQIDSVRVWKSPRTAAEIVAAAQR